MGVAHLDDPTLVLGHDMGERRRPPITVTGPMPVGEQDESHPSGAQDTVHLGHESDGLGQMLQDVAGDHEVLAGVRDRTQPFGVEVGEHVGLGERALRGQLREQLAALVGPPTVDVAHRDAGQGELEGVLSRPHLDARSEQMPGQQ